MTSLIAWVSYPKSGNATTGDATAIYLASDSRITWASKAKRWDAGHKLFAASSAAHVFGYCGDVVFPSLVLAQVTAAIDHNLLFDDGAPYRDKNTIILSAIQSSFQQRHNAPDESFSIIHALRDKWGKVASFHLWRIDYDHHSKEWKEAALPLPSATGTIIELGSGAKSTRSFGQRWRASDVGGTSRSVFSAFCDSLRSNEDPFSGGAPQLVALYTKGPAYPLGVWFDGQRYLHGLRLAPSTLSSKTEWRDELFQRVDFDGQPLKGARRYARPFRKS